MSILKRRRYLRYEIKLPATLVVEHSVFIKGTIQDFCSGGLYILLQPQNGFKSLQLQQTVKIQFSVSMEHGGEDFILESKIRQISPNGIGLSFEEDASAAFEALKKEAESSIGLTIADRRSDSAKLSKQNKLEADLFTLLSEWLPHLIGNFFNRSKAKLLEAAERVENFEHRAALLDAFTNLEMHKDALTENFCSSSQKPLHLLVFQDSEKNEQPNAKPTLSLIEKDDFEDWLNLSAIVRKLNSLYEQQLDVLQKKMAYIIGVDQNAVTNPASPQKLCELFRDALIDFEPNPTVKRTHYTVFEEALNECLPTFYDKVDLVLQRHGAPSKFADIACWKKVTPASDHRKEPPNRETKRGQERPVFHSGTVVASDNTVLAHEPVLAPQNTRPVIDVARNLINLLQGQVSPKKTVTANQSDFSPEYSADEISNALIQIQKKAVNDDVIHYDLVELRQELLQRLKGVAGAHKTLSVADNNILEVYENLFKTLCNDMSLTQEIQAYLEKIQLPILSQALRDRRFLESDDHPSRNIVNYLAWLESGVKENKLVRNTRIRETLDQLLDQIANESLNDPSVFTSVERQLNEITQLVNKSIDRNIKRVTETYEGKQKLEKARQSVDVELNEYFANKSIPEIILSLLDAGWQHLLVLAKLNETAHDEPAYLNYWRIIINLNGWLTGSEKVTAEHVRTTLEVIDTQLQSVCTNSFLHQKILHQLTALLLNDDMERLSSSIKMVTFTPHETLKRIRKTPNQTEEIDQLRVGEWLTFLLNGEIEPLKLVWISELQDLYVFVNRNGIKKLELEREEFSELIKTGTANTIESLDVPIMDRATNKMLQKMHEKLLYNATHDPVTGLINRKEFLKRLKQELIKLDETSHVLCNIEVLDYRIITNSCGHAGGDALVKQVADLLKSNLREQELLARPSDKTFSILLKNCTAEIADTVARKLQSQFIDSHFKWQDKSYAIGISIGMALFENNSYDINSLLQKADAATLSAKNAGRNRIQIYKEDDQQLKLEHSVHEWAGRIDQVFINNRLFIRCQKIAEIASQKTSPVHYEILLGIKDEKGFIIAPDDFIPAVERCRRMSEIDRWVILTVFSWIEQHQSAFELLDGFSINLSGESLNSEEFLDFLKHTLASSNVPLEKITFEITETVAASSFRFTQQFIKQIRRFNCKFSLDDFGSGYSSYSYLKSLSIDYLKIDGVFVKDILNNPADVAIVRSIHEVANSLGLKTIAEYVENDKILALLKEIGIDYAQGWGIQQPILLDDLAYDAFSQCENENSF